ncbi:hypothetical protein [Formosa sp. S-31]|uniref:hypothetical protein n=1 Tax=Formosa sp. S-31 TaxID=2790949 RepID=UPI003EBFD290
MKLKFGILSLVIVLAFQACTEKEDDLISQNCETNCTEIIGKLMTDNATVPIVNRKITVVWDNTTYGAGVLRKKATTRTNEKGEFNLKFLIRDDELEEGIHTMYYDELDEDKFIETDLRRISIYPLKRDTIYIRNHNVPKKAFLDLTLLNLDDYQQKDYFSTNFDYITPVGFSQSVSGLVRGWSNEFESNQLIEIAGNQPVALQIVRKINDVFTREYDTLFVDAGTTKKYTIDFNN